MGDVGKFQRTTCVACEKSLKDYKHLHSFVNFPVYMGISTNRSVSEDLVEDMIWVSCNSCGTVQLLKLIEPTVLYQRPHNPSIGSTWAKHHQSFARFVLQYSGKNILEIGGGNRILQKEVLSDASVERYTVCDVHGYGTEEVDPRARHIQNYVDANSGLHIDCDTVIHSHTFEHFYEPVAQTRMFAKLLKPGQKMIMSVPNIKKVTEDKFTNGLNFEHTFLLSERILHHIIATAGFDTEALVNYSAHNFFVSSTRKNSRKRRKRHLKMDQAEQAVFLEFIEFHMKEARRIQNLIDNTDSQVFLFGCHIFSQYLLSFGVNQEKIAGVLDNDPNKIGNRLYGTPLLTYSPKMLAGISKPLVVLKAGIYTDEIKKDIVENCNSQTEFIL